MDKKIKILIITDEVWNDKVHPNNILTNWFEGFEAEFANVYASPDYPANETCYKYLQITDQMMLKSIFTRKKAGLVLQQLDYQTNNAVEASRPKFFLYSIVKKYFYHFAFLIREFLWLLGRFDENLILEFINDFGPDIIFSPRLASLKMIRIEKKVYRLANAPMVAFTGDAEYSLRFLKISPFFWIRRLLLMSSLRRQMKNYSLYYTLSEIQLKEYKSKFLNEFKVLHKGSNYFNIESKIKTNDPLKLVYAGKLYSGRLKTLLMLAKSIKAVNENSLEMILNIYTHDKVSRRYSKILDDRQHSFLNSPVSSRELLDIIPKHDIALHVESLGLKKRYDTRVSFSTKVIDCLSSSCAVMVISWNQHEVYKYLESMNAALLAHDKISLNLLLRSLASDRTIILEYSNSAIECGKNNHDINKIRDSLRKDFYKVIKIHKTRNV